MRTDNNGNDPDPLLIQVYKFIRIIIAVFIFIVAVVAGTISRKFPDGFILGLLLGIILTAFFWFLFGYDIRRAKTAYKQFPVLFSQIKQARQNKARGIVDPRQPKYDLQDWLSLLSIFVCCFAAMMLLMPWWAHTLKEDIPRAVAFWVLIGCAMISDQLFRKRRVTGKTAVITAVGLIFGVCLLLGRIFQIW